MFQSDPALNPGPHTNRLTHTGKHSPTLVDNLREEGKKKESKTDGIKPWQALVSAQQRTEDIQSSCELRRQSNALALALGARSPAPRTEAAKSQRGNMTEPQQLRPVRTRRSMYISGKWEGGGVGEWIDGTRGKKKNSSSVAATQARGKEKNKVDVRTRYKGLCGCLRGTEGAALCFPRSEEIGLSSRPSVTSSCISSRGFVDHGWLLETPYLLCLFLLFLAGTNAHLVDNNKLNLELHLQTRLSSLEELWRSLLTGQYVTHEKRLLAASVPGYTAAWGWYVYKVCKANTVCASFFHAKGEAMKSATYSTNNGWINQEKFIFRRIKVLGYSQYCSWEEVAKFNTTIWELKFYPVKLHQFLWISVRQFEELLPSAGSKFRRGREQTIES